MISGVRGAPREADIDGQARACLRVLGADSAAIPNTGMLVKYRAIRRSGL